MLLKLLTLASLILCYSGAPIEYEREDGLENGMEENLESPTIYTDTGYNNNMTLEDRVLNVEKILTIHGQKLNQVDDQMMYIVGIMFHHLNWSKQNSYSSPSNNQTTNYNQNGGQTNNSKNQNNGQTNNSNNQSGGQANNSDNQNGGQFYDQNTGQFNNQRNQNNGQVNDSQRNQNNGQVNNQKNQQTANSPFNQNNGPAAMNPSNQNNEQAGRNPYNQNRGQMINNNNQNNGPRDGQSHPINQQNSPGNQNDYQSSNSPLGPHSFDGFNRYVNHNFWHANNPRLQGGDNSQANPHNSWSQNTRPDNHQSPNNNQIPSPNGNTNQQGGFAQTNSNFHPSNRRGRLFGGLFSYEQNSMERTLGGLYFNRPMGGTSLGGESFEHFGNGQGRYLGTAGRHMFSNNGPWDFNTNLHSPPHHHTNTPTHQRTNDQNFQNRNPQQPNKNINNQHQNQPDKNNKTSNIASEMNHRNINSNIPMHGNPEDPQSVDSNTIPQNSATTIQTTLQPSTVPMQPNELDENQPNNGQVTDQNLSNNINLFGTKEPFLPISNNLVDGETQPVIPPPETRTDNNFLETLDNHRGFGKNDKQSKTNSDKQNGELNAERSDTGRINHEAESEGRSQWNHEIREHEEQPPYGEDAWGHEGREEGEFNHGEQGEHEGQTDHEGGEHETQQAMVHKNPGESPYDQPSAILIPLHIDE